MWNIFKINNKITRTTSLTLFWCFYCSLWTYFTPFSKASIAYFEQVNDRWELMAESCLSFLQKFPSQMLDRVQNVPLRKTKAETKVWITNTTRSAAPISDLFKRFWEQHFLRIWKMQEFRICLPLKFLSLK